MSKPSGLPKRDGKSAQLRQHLPELKKAASKAERKSRLHQWLTHEIGHPKLKEHLASLISVMKLSNSPKDFIANVNIVHPRYGDTKQLDLDNPNAGSAAY